MRQIRKNVGQAGGKATRADGPAHGNRRRDPGDYNGVSARPPAGVTLPDDSIAMRLLLKLSRRLMPACDLPSLLGEVLDGAIELLKADLGCLQLYDKEAGLLDIAAQRGFGPEFLEHFQRVSVGGGSVCAQALAIRSRVIVEDVEQDPAFAPHRGVAAQAGFRAVQSTPLFNRRSGDLVGILSTHFRHPHRPSEGELRHAELYLQQAADVVALRLSEQRLRESEARLQAAIDLVGLGCYSWNPQTNALDWDSRVKAMWALSPDASVDYATFAAGVHPNDLGRVEEAIAICADPNRDGIYDIQYRVRGIGDGVERWIATRGETYFENGVATGFFGVARDISAQMQHEATLQHLNDTLEQRVTQRTAEAEEANRKLRSEIAERTRAEIRLQELQAELSHAARLSSVGQLAGTLAHEVSQPLGAIGNFVNAACRLLADDDHEDIAGARRNMEDATAQVLRVGEIIKRVRDFVGQGETDRRRVDVVQMVREAGSIALVGPPALGVETRFQFDPRAVLVFADRVQIQQVLVNLIRNALDAMSRSERRELVISLELRDRDIVAILVADSGPGLSPEIADRLFQPFTSTKRSGMGLGLSICLGIVEAHGGRLWSTPNPTGGTIFGFSLDVASTAERDNAG